MLQYVSQFIKYLLTTSMLCGTCLVTIQYRVTSLLILKIDLGMLISSSSRSGKIPG